MSIVRGMIAPHPPIIIPEVGGREMNEAADTIQALKTLAEKIKKLAPELLIFITPHGVVFRDAVAVTVSKHLKGDFARFQAPQVVFTADNDPQVAGELLELARINGINTVALDEEAAVSYAVSADLDHGITVPLYYLRQAGIECPVLPIAMGFLSYEELYRFGTLIRKAVERVGRKTVIVASGDLSHRLTQQAPAGFHPRGKEFDAYLVDRLKQGDILEIINMSPELVDCAGECGLRPIIMMLGAFDGYEIKSEVYSYEGPFGVGYLVGEIEESVPSPERKFIDLLLEQKAEAVARKRNEVSAPVALARKTLETYVRTGRIIEPPKDLPAMMKARAGVFVSLKKNGQLRGCIGTIEPIESNTAQEIIKNAISAGTRDPRFNPVTSRELDDLVYSVDVLSPPEAISGMDQLDPEKYGVIVRSGYKSGLLLPKLEGIDTASEQVEIAMRKAGIFPGEEIQLERFEVVRYY